MSPFDIYGNPLARGHCEVHPYVHEEYPCPMCLAEDYAIHEQQEAERRYWADREEAYYAEMARDLNAGIDGDGI